MLSDKGDKKKRTSFGSRLKKPTMDVGFGKLEKQNLDTALFIITHLLQPLHIDLHMSYILAKYQRK
jgi:hypothetical protein